MFPDGCIAGAIDITHYLQKSWTDEGVEVEYLRQIKELVHSGSTITALRRNAFPARVLKP